VEVVEDDLRLGQVGRHRRPVGRRHVHGHRRDLGPAGPQPLPERLQRAGPLAIADEGVDRRPDTALAVGDDRLSRLDPGPGQQAEVRVAEAALQFVEGHQERGRLGRDRTRRHRDQRRDEGNDP
jgi:hypothetical protein